jgi:DNA-binding FadR family transcriptional regulator
VQLEDHFHTPALRQSVLEDHRNVFLALVERNPRGARKAMREHLDRVTKEFARSWKSTGSERRTK